MGPPLPVARACGWTSCPAARTRSPRGRETRWNMHLNKDCQCFDTHASSSLLRVCLGYPGVGKGKSKENKSNHVTPFRESRNRGYTLPRPHCLDTYKCFLNGKITRGGIWLLGLDSSHLAPMALPLPSFTLLGDHNGK